MPPDDRGTDAPGSPSSRGGATAKLGKVGGTFTDLALWDAGRRRLTVFKLPSVPRDPSEGILAGIRAMTARDGVAVSALDFVAHGTTVATNALLEKRGARTALILNEGTPAERALPPKVAGLRLVEGDAVTIVTPGAGGYGPPGERDDALLARDLAEGKITLAADVVYGRCEGGR